MMEVANPVIKKVKDSKSSLKALELEMDAGKNKKEQKLIRHYPTVYIHTWKKRNYYEVYVGESNDIFRRTEEHYRNSQINKWQYKLEEKKADLYVIGHEHFNKSLTLDIENELIHYLLGVKDIKKVHNAKFNPQNQYYTSEEFRGIFNKIWKKLRKYDNVLFPLESRIADSAIFKASPLHKLTMEQQEAKDLIISKVLESLLSDKRGQLIFIEGESGTGKTVLNSSIFYELCCMFENSAEENSRFHSKKLECRLIVNHKEQRNVYKQICKKLCINEGTSLVYSPTSFINKYDKNNIIDVAFVDEAHLLLTQGRQSYTGKNQLQDILDRAKTTIILFDSNQILTTEQYWEYELLEKYKNKAKEEGSYIVLKEQLRIHANKQVLKWIDNFSKNSMVNNLPKETGRYEIKVFDTPKLLEQAIKEKARMKGSELSRLVATYDWKYDEKKTNNGQMWEVVIDNWRKPWNYQLEKNFDYKQKREIADMSWAEQPHTVEEIGSTFTIQGFDLNYVGLIIGPSVKFDNNQIVFSPDYSRNKKAVRRRGLSDGTYKSFAKQLLKNELRVLMTRGVNGLYIYAYDEKLREHLKKCAGRMYISD